MVAVAAMGQHAHSPAAERLRVIAASDPEAEIRVVATVALSTLGQTSGSDES
jgi:hypothetical protein